MRDGKCRPFKQPKCECYIDWAFHTTSTLYFIFSFAHSFGRLERIWIWLHQINEKTLAYHLFDLKTRAATYHCHIPVNSAHLLVVIVYNSQLFYTVASAIVFTSINSIGFVHGLQYYNFLLSRNITGGKLPLQKKCVHKASNVLFLNDSRACAWLFLALAAATVPLY